MYLYTGKLDLACTFLQIPIIGIALGSMGAVSTDRGALALVIFAAALLVFSFFHALRANRSAWMAMGVFPLKYTFAVALVGSGIVAVGGTLMLLQGEVKKKDMVGHVAKTAGGAFLFWHLARWTQSLIRPPASGNAIGSERRAAEVEG
ncbi:hypothetical protein Ga0100231_001175 [Opitutaceae bacterium TAV4]|nr:hypothetical protein Ga0100230_011620 [Opitutaceae bacterium TAV3]RRK01446.1 hypothetical protein Ga0100231_001175 [Opitutaceae bacterium TAV4]